MKGLRTHNAGNRGLFTLDGTRTFVVGERDVVVIDPGPADRDHVGRIAADVKGAERVRVLLTHGHADHAGAVGAVASATWALVFGSGHHDARPLVAGERFTTDAGEVEVVNLPGHTPDHVGYCWTSERVLFAGDLLLGTGNTTWVAGYRECVADYLASLDRVDRLNVHTILPAHGPALEDPIRDVDRFRQHRLERIEQVRESLALHPGAGPADLVVPVYGQELPSAVRGYAEESIAAILDHLEATT